ncbi:MAG TPA: CRISPR-associated endonuclease Cas2 [Planctomycetota bacterium]|nr:CRISPR-associated endonuclease Cas2 [Planctomycetota bacterium]
MSTWTFRRRHGACSQCERDFEAGEPHFSALSVEGEQLAREDSCRACWRALEQVPQAERPQWLFWWRTRHEVGRKRGLALNLEAIEALFLGLEGRAEVRLRELRYVLCLLLMRKRRLKIARILRDAEGESMLVRRPRRQESLRVFVYDFDAERMAELREELRRVFDSDEGLAGLAAGSAVQAGDGATDPDGDVAADTVSDELAAT